MKLVRDYIPQIIEEEENKTCEYHIADREEYARCICDKMIEELEEFTENPSYEEAADMYEVLRSLCILHDLDIDGVESVALDKRETHGGFHLGIVLDKVVDWSKLDESR
jgi:predicted house-cleaning noncanonical NTP pyrophosphatase (MazG superfamily)